MQLEPFNLSLLDFLRRSPTPFHATRELADQLQSAGFEPLNEADSWSLEPGGRYFVTRNDSSVIAFAMPAVSNLAEIGLRMLGAHTDSPCLKIKPTPERVKEGYFQLGVEVYGGALLNPWFDRDLSLAGRVSYIDPQGRLAHALVDFEAPIAVVPSLAIHLDRGANEEHAINPQQHLPLLLSIADKNHKPELRTLLLEKLRQQGDAVAEVLDFDLYCYDTQPPALIGLNKEFIASARLDNLLSCFVGLQSLLQASAAIGQEGSGQDQAMLLVCNDHEEVGSLSSSGANGPFLEQVLERMLSGGEDRQRMLARSVMISADNAHGIHPNFSDKHDANHGPLLNGGPVIKLNANQRYATSSATSALFRQLARLENVPVQAFTVRSDMACGSTIGPITAAKIGVPTLDIGVPTFAMHSIRELAGSEDAFGLFKVLRRFFVGPN
tara:strand:- start:4419 stop:5735 length:1317 start_codon:yes stop_codon:yes gene_type:complete